MDSYQTVFLGGGMVAGYALREMAERGSIPQGTALISADSALPYERPPLSKGFLAGEEDEASVFINDEAFYGSHGIDVRLGTIVDGIDFERRQLAVRGGEPVGFERLVVATGASPRTFRLPGAELEGIHYLRSLDDSKRIRDSLEGARRAVVIGAGMEVASVLARKGMKTTMVFPEGRVWEAFFTPEMSAFFERYYRERGVEFAPGEKIARFEGDGRLAAVALESGRRLECDLVVAGIGVIPATGFLDGSGIEIDNGVVVDEYLEASRPNVWAAGDVANYRDVLFDKRRRVEHWDNATEQGKHLARLLVGERAPFVHVPYFFSDVFDLSYEYWGDSAGAMNVTHRGDVDGGAFSAWWEREGRVVAAFVMDRPDEERELAQELIREKRGLPGDY
jgi:3-phenylpropionate/trans-cinnamate dioxygenase ferredoxin reductase subunit